MAGGVGIHPQRPHLGEKGVEGSLHLLGPDPLKVKGRSFFAGGTGGGGRRYNKRAEMAGEVVGLFMEGQADRTVGTLDTFAAASAHLKGMIASPV